MVARQAGTLACLLVLFASVVAGAGPAQGWLDEGACESCKLTLRVASDALCDPGAEEFLVNMIQTNICPSTPDKQQCAELALALMPVAIQYIRGALTPAQLCHDVGVCGTSILAVPAMNKPHVPMRKGYKSVECGLCTYVVNYVKAAIDDPTNQATIWKDLQAACSALPAEMSGSCTDLVTNYGTLLISLIDSVDASTGCALMGMCFEPLANMKLPPLTPQLVQVLAATENLFVHNSAPLGVHLDTNQCDICKMMVLELHTLISNPVTQQSLNGYAKTLCNTTGAFAAQCSQYVDIYSPLFFSLMSSYTSNPDPVCQAMHVCAPPSLMQTLRTAIITKPVTMLRLGAARHEMRVRLAESEQRARRRRAL